MVEGRPASLHFLLPPALPGAFPPVWGKSSWSARGAAGTAAGRRRTWAPGPSSRRAEAEGGGQAGSEPGCAARRTGLSGQRPGGGGERRRPARAHSPHPHLLRPPQPCSLFPARARRTTTCPHSSFTCFALRSAIAARVAVAASSQVRHGAPMTLPESRSALFLGLAPAGPPACQAPGPDR